MLYLYIKSLHIIALICWYAGLFYLPRLFVYHASTTDDISHKRFSLMAYRLYYFIMMPSMIFTVLSGFWLASILGVWAQTWFQLKLSLVILLLIFHFSCGFFQSKLASGTSHYSERFFRFFNEIPTLILLIVIPLVVVKPF
ncbi:MAG: protoporphyrinogen oxidase HemJ [Candidatus Comchoanobacterales bacterium]